MTLLSARDLCVQPPGSAAATVRGFSLSIERGEWVGISGPNGGGKTSLLLGLAGLWPAGGELRLKGEPFGPTSDPDRRRPVAVILQDPSSQLLQPTVHDEVAFSARNLGFPEPEVRRKVDLWCERLGLSEDLGRDPARLSAGRQQLAVIAAALVLEPELLLADEPTAHLDSTTRRRVLGAVGEEVGRGLGAVWVTQLEEELQFVHRRITIGAQVPWQRSVAAAPPAVGAIERLRIRVGARRDQDGPGVATGRDFEISIGSTGIVGLTGPNAVGKSVILLAAAGLKTPAQVSVSWNGAPKRPPIAALQYPEQQIFQEVASDEIAFASVSRGEPRLRALDQAAFLLEQMGFEAGAFLEKRTWGMASGEKRIMEIVAALVAPADLYLLDEPTAGLDPERREALAQVVRRTSAVTPVLLASQDRDWVTRLPARVVELGP